MTNTITSDSSLSEIILKLVDTNKPFTDILIEESEKIAWYVPFGFKNIDADVIADRAMIDEFLTMMVGKDWEARMSIKGAIDFSRPLKNCQLRINAYYTRNKSRISIAVRKHALEAPPISSSPLSLATKRMLGFKSNGLFIVTGATGSAKTTTLASIVHYFNNQAKLNGAFKSSHIVTIEEPVEFIHERKNGIISHKNVGVDCPSFASGLRDALREKPDVILIGEVRDRETAEVMLQAGESGHLVLATLHTSSCVSAISKILSFFPEDEQASIRQSLSSSLIGITSQVMLPVEDGFVVASESLVNNNAKLSELIGAGKISDLQAYMEKTTADPKTDGSAETLNSQLYKLFKESRISGELAVKSSYNPMDMLDKVNPK